MTSRSTVLLAVLASTIASGCGRATNSNALLSTVDHLVYATPDLDRGISEIDALLGIRATLGGSHPGRGTRNALIALGPNMYLEIIAPDPEQPAPSSPRAFGLDTLKASRLAGWAAKSHNVDSLRSAAAAAGVPLGEANSGSRKRPDGVTLSWRSTDSGVAVADGLVPFFIDWGQSPHPSQTAPKGARLVALRAEHPNERAVTGMLRVLSLNLPVTHGRQALLVATIESARGRVELR